MGRAQICCDKAIVKKGHWSPEEDKQLKEYIEKHGNGGNWISLPRKAGLKRCGKSCRLRWLNYLRPDIKHGSFSDTEDMIITNLYATIGSRWSIIASHLPGRTDNEIKNYWNTNLKKKFSGILTTPPKRIMQQQQQQQQDYTLTPSLDALNHLILSIPGIENLPNAACLLSLLTSTASGSGSAGTGTGTVGSPQLLQCAEEETSNFSNFGASSNLRCLSTHSDGSVDQSLGIVGEAWGGASSLLGQSKLDHKCELMPVVAAAAGSIDLCFDGYGGAREGDQVPMYYY